MAEQLIPPESEPWPGPPVAVIRITGAHEIFITAPPGIDVKVSQQ
jgi:hypothetical protein